MELAMESDTELLLDSPIKVGREREWIYFKLKQKVAATETIQLGEVKELVRLLAEIESSMDDGWQSPGRYRDLDGASLNELIEAHRSRLPGRKSATSSGRN